MKEEFKSRIKELIEEGQSLLDTNDIDRLEMILEEPRVERGCFSKWKTRCEVALRSIASLEPSYITNFSSSTQNNFKKSARSALGILEALLNDLDEGYLDNLENKVLQKTYANLLVSAQEFLEDGFKEPAGVLAGVALEETLKQVGKIRLTNYSMNWKFGTLNQKLADAYIYNDGRRNELDNLYKIRNYANHAEWDEFDEVQVKNMINTINKLIADYL